MNEKYVESGYVEVGYVEGDELFTSPELGSHPLKFFVSGGTGTEEELKEKVSDELIEGQLAIIYMPETSKIIFGTGNGFSEFLGGLDIQSILTNQAFIDKVSELAQISLTASIVGSDGSIVADATVTQIDETTISVEVPPEMVGTSYNIVFSES